jgi:hypothetical protein
MGVLALLAAAGCAGRWMTVPEPGRLPQDIVGPRRDYRAVLRNDSMVVLLDAVVRGDSIVELPKGQTRLERAGLPRAVALADVAQVELWQPGSERVAGGAALAVLAILAAIGYLIVRAVGGSGS